MAEIRIRKLWIKASNPSLLVLRHSEKCVEHCSPHLRVPSVYNLAYFPTFHYHPLLLFHCESPHLQSNRNQPRCHSAYLFSSRSYCQTTIPKNLYKWEDNNHGLEHKCGICKTPLSSSKAKKTCLGIHQEICTRYHKTLFFLGSSHHCDACHKTDELHDKRHREIVKLIKYIRDHDHFVNGETSPSARKKPKRSSISSESGSRHNSQEGISEQGVEDWNDSSTLVNDEFDWRAEIRSDLLEVPGNGKLAKTDRKTAKHQAQAQKITANDLATLNLALHPELANMTEKNRQDASQGLIHDTIKGNVTFNTHTANYTHVRASFSKKRPDKAYLYQQIKGVPDNSEQQEAIIDSIFEKLGLDSKLKRGNKDHKALDSKLRKAIFQDVIAAANEEVERMQQMAGYWRYVNRCTYNAMIRVNEIWDWAAGTKLPEIEEETNISETDESDSDETLTGSPVLEPSDASSQIAEGEKNLDDLVGSDNDVALGSKKGKDEITFAVPPQEPQAGDAFYTVFPQNDPDKPWAFSSGHRCTPSLTITVPSPPSRHSFRDSPDVSLEDGGGKFSPTSASCHPTISDPQATDGRHTGILMGKDDHAENEPPSLPSHTKLPLASKENNNPKHNENYRRASSIKSVKEVAIFKDVNNRFRGLEIETPAPREEVGPEAPTNVRSMPFKRSSFSNLHSEAGVSAAGGSALDEMNVRSPPPEPKSISISMTAVKLVEAKEKASSGRRKKGKGEKDLRASKKGEGREKISGVSKGAGMDGGVEVDEWTTA